MALTSHASRSHTSHSHDAKEQGIREIAEGAPCERRAVAGAHV
jgi:hypothetical protein